MPGSLLDVLLDYLLDVLKESLTQDSTKTIFQCVHGHICFCKWMPSLKKKKKERKDAQKLLGGPTLNHLQRG